VIKVLLDESPRCNLDNVLPSKVGVQTVQDLVPPPQEARVSDDGEVFADHIRRVHEDVRTALIIFIIIIMLHLIMF
jgi:hypothetical protein